MRISWEIFFFSTIMRVNNSIPQHLQLGTYIKNIDTPIGLPKLPVL